MLIVLPWAPPSSSAITARIGTLEVVGRRNTTSRPSSSSVVSRCSSMPARSAALSGIVTDWAVGRLSADARRPRDRSLRRTGPSSAPPAPQPADCLVVLVDDRDRVLAPVSWIAALIWSIAMSAAFWPGGPKGARSPVSGPNPRSRGRAAPRRRLRRRHRRRRRRPPRQGPARDRLLRRGTSCASDSHAIPPHPVALP